MIASEQSEKSMTALEKKTQWLVLAGSTHLHSKPQWPLTLLHHPFECES